MILCIKLQASCWHTTQQLGVGDMPRRQTDKIILNTVLKLH